MRFTKPSKRYDAELRQVANAAEDLFGFLTDQPNMLPIGFPSDSVMTLCSALRQLPLGSVEGSVPILEAGREQFPTVRRNYIPPELPSDDPDYDPDAPPVFRGGELDTLVNDIYVSIGTAIDAYKAEYGDGFQEGIEIDPPVAAMPEFVLEAAIANSRNAEISISDIQKEHTELLAANDEIQRGLYDTDSELKVARSTASMPEPKPNLLSRLGDTISKAPEALQSVGRAAQVIADVANPLVAAGTKIALSSWQAMLDAISMAGAGIEESGRRLAAWRDKGWKKEREEPADKDSTNTIPFDQGAAETSIVAADALPEEWYSQVERLSLGGTKHSAWVDLEQSCNLISRCKNLKYLDMSSAPIENLAFMEALSHLREARLSATKIRNLDGIGELQNLRILHLNGAKSLEDIGAISSLERLTALQIRNTSVKSLAPILDLKDIEILVLADDQFSDDELEDIEDKFPHVKIQNVLRRRRRRRRKKEVE